MTHPQPLETKRVGRIIFTAPPRYDTMSDTVTYLKQANGDDSPIKG